MSNTYFRSARGLSRLAQRSFATTTRQQLDSTKGVPTPAAPASTESPVPKKESQVPVELPQAPNRKEIWSRSQRPRQEAMTGPRFEQTDFDLQVCFSSLFAPRYRRRRCRRGMDAIVC